MIDDRLAIGVDIGGTKIAFVLIDRDGQVLAEHRLPTDPHQGEDAVIERIVRGIMMLRDAARKSIAGVGIGSPGHVDPVQGVVRNAVNLGWQTVTLRDVIASRMPEVPFIYLQNDGNASALGEMYFGAAQGCLDFVHLSIGTGFGAGAMVRGELLDGTNFLAFEIGHLSLDLNGRLCSCGQQGCVEMYASGVGLVAGARALLPQYPASQLASVESLSGSIVFNAALEGDVLAIRVWTEAVEWMHRVVAICAVTLNPALFVIGGGLGHAAADMLLPLLETELAKRTLPAVYEGVRFAESQITSSAVGAACLVWHELEHL